MNLDATFDEPTPAQREGWGSIALGDHTLAVRGIVKAPTGKQDVGVIAYDIKLGGGQAQPLTDHAAGIGAGER